MYMQTVSLPSAAERSGLMLMPHTLETAHVEAMREEAASIGQRGLSGALYMELTNSKHSPGAVESTLLRGGAARKYPGMELLIDLTVGLSKVDRVGLIIIRYMPGAFQRFHVDHRDTPVACAPLDPNAALDFTGAPIDWSHPEADLLSYAEPDYIPDTYGTVETQPGDVLVQILPKLLHRGRNTGDTERYNALIYTN
jgi:hypothetical protein